MNFIQVVSLQVPPRYLRPILEEMDSMVVDKKTSTENHRRDEIENMNAREYNELSLPDRELFLKTVLESRKISYQRRIADLG